jgi:hypothetical protein
MKPNEGRVEFGNTVFTYAKEADVFVIMKSRKFGERLNIMGARHYHGREAEIASILVTSDVMSETLYDYLVDGHINIVRKEIQTMRTTDMIDFVSSILDEPLREYQKKHMEKMFSSMDLSDVSPEHIVGVDIAKDGKDYTAVQFNAVGTETGRFSSNGGTLRSGKAMGLQNHYAYTGKGKSLLIIDELNEINNPELLPCDVGVSKMYQSELSATRRKLFIEKRLKVIKKDIKKSKTPGVVKSLRKEYHELEQEYYDLGGK